jgi:GntR family transcriptional regulator
LRLLINPSDGLPIYRQIVQQVVDAIAGGRARAGDRLPSHRELAADLVIAPLTVKKAYDQLERDGYIKMLRGQGTFVSDRPPSLSDESKLGRLRPIVRRLLHEAVLLGVDTRSLKELISDESKSLQVERSDPGASRKQKP